MFRCSLRLFGKYGYKRYWKQKHTKSAIEKFEYTDACGLIFARNRRVWKRTACMYSGDVKSVTLPLMFWTNWGIFPVVEIQQSGQLIIRSYTSWLFSLDLHQISSVYLLSQLCQRITDVCTGISPEMFHNVREFLSHMFICQEVQSGLLQNLQKWLSFNVYLYVSDFIIILIMEYDLLVFNNKFIDMVKIKLFANKNHSFDYF